MEIFFFQQLENLKYLDTWKTFLGASRNFKS